MAKTFCKGHVAVIINNPPILKGVLDSQHTLNLINNMGDIIVYSSLKRV